MDIKEDERTDMQMVERDDKTEKWGRVNAVQETIQNFLLTIFADSF